MTMTLKDVQPGMCWRFTSKTAPDNRPTYTITDEEAGEDGVVPPLPPGWDDHYYEPDDEGSSAFYQKHAHEPVQLLMHFKKAPEGRPIEDYEAVPTSKVRPSQWYIGIWNEASAKAVASSLNRKEVSTKSYHRGYGPISDPGWAVVRTMPEKPEPFVANPPRILSCIDPFKDLSDAVFVLAEFHVDGLKGSECLARFERAQQTESLARPRADVDKLVSTNAACGLTVDQVEHARDLWTATLRLKIARQKSADVERERTRVVVDYVDD